MFNRISCCLPLGFFSAVSLQLGLNFLLAAVFVTLAWQEAMTFLLPIFCAFFVRVLCEEPLRFNQKGTREVMLPHLRGPCS